MQTMLHVTELADSLLQAGEFDVYQETKEKIAFRCQEGSHSNGQRDNSHTTLTEPHDAEDNELDLLGSTFDGEQTTAPRGSSQVHQSRNKAYTTVEGLNTCVSCKFFGGLTSKFLKLQTFPVLKER